MGLDLKLVFDELFGSWALVDVGPTFRSRKQVLKDEAWPGALAQVY